MVSVLALSMAGMTVLSVPATAQTTAPEQESASSFDVTGAEVTWGVKQSFRNYIQSPIAGGSWSVDGAEADDAGIVTWSDGAGAVNMADSATGSISYSGGVHYTGHEGMGEDGGFALSVELTNPTIEFQQTASGAEGTLLVNVESLPYGSAGGVSAQQVEFAELTFADDFTIGADELSGTAEATLTAEGSEAFVGFYDAGQALDPLEVSAVLTPVAEDEEEVEAPTPELSVDPTTALNPDGHTLTITGEGFDATAQAPVYLPVDEAGFYAQIGWIDDQWRPSAGAESAARSNSYSVWVQGTNADAPYLLWEDNADGTADFTWEVEIDQETLEESYREGAQLAVFTIGAGGVTQEVNEIAVPISFAEPTAPEPSEEPTELPSEGPTEQPSEEPTEEPAEQPTEGATEQPGGEVTEQPTDEATEQPSEEVSEQPTEGQTEPETPGDTGEPSEQPSDVESTNGAVGDNETDSTIDTAAAPAGNDDADDAAGAEAEPTNGLANTGAEAGLAAALGVLLLVIGGVAAVIARTRNAAHKN